MMPNLIVMMPDERIADWLTGVQRGKVTFSVVPFTK